MNGIRKVPASAGAEWVMGGFALLRKSPFGLGLLGMLYGLVVLLLAASARLGTGAFMLLELVMVLVGPLLMGGIAFAVRSVDEGRPAVPAHLLEGFRAGRPRRLLLTLLPNIAAIVLCMILLYALVGGETLLRMVDALERAGASGSADPGMFDGFPFDRFALWVLMALVIGVFAGFFTFAAIPEIMFTDHGAFAAMGRSFRACVGSLPAFVVMLVLLLISVIAVYIAVMIVGAIANALAGPAAMQVVVQLLTTAVLMPVAMGTVYTAWKQMLAGGAVAEVPTIAGIEA